ncbi:MAG: hypothetical protein K8S15_02930 [Candidatus Aegiribacteria sp.]|nr:hypothetical protein [Candidatus Aegiribacteria sp.]
MKMLSLRFNDFDLSVIPAVFTNFSRNVFRTKKHLDLRENPIPLQSLWNWNVNPMRYIPWEDDVPEIEVG